MVADKTGSLIATSARFGAMLSAADEQAVEVLTRFGERIGIAFQLSDDLLDVLSDSAESGKTPGTDLREGIPTLPVLLMRRARPARADARLLELLDAGLADDADAPRGARRCCAPTRRWPRRGPRSAAGRDAARATLRAAARTAGQGSARVPLRPGRRPHHLTLCRSRCSAVVVRVRAAGERERVARLPQLTPVELDWSEVAPLESWKARRQRGHFASGADRGGAAPSSQAALTSATTAGAVTSARVRG